MSRLFPLFQKVHLVVGLTLGLVAVLIGLTGTALAFREELDRALSPALYAASQGPSLPLDSLVATAQALAPTQPVTRVFLPVNPGDPARVAVKQLGTVFLDPAKGTVLGVRHPGEAPMDKVLDLHRELLMGDAGNKVVIAGAIGLFGLSLSGLVLWARRKGAAKWRWSLPPKAPAIRAYREWHSVIGAYVAVALLVLPWTGLSFVFRDQVVALYSAVTHSEVASTKPPEVMPWTTRVKLSTMVDAARTAFPDAAVRQVRIPTDADKPVQVQLFQPGEVNRLGNTTVYIEPYTGQVMKTIDPFHAPWGWRLYYTLNYPLHTGQIGGWATQALWCVFGAMPALLFVTGAGFWWQKRKAKRQALAKAQPTSQPEPVSLGS